MTTARGEAKKLSPDVSGDAITLKTVSGAELTPGEVDACIEVIHVGGAVDVESARRELPLAAVIVLAIKGTRIISVGAIKRERPDYVRKIASRAAVEFASGTLEVDMSRYTRIAVGADFRVGRLKRFYFSTGGVYLRRHTTNTWKRRWTRQDLVGQDRNGKGGNRCCHCG